jgi:DNA-binding transcriptional ArsR family regulator
MVVDTRPDAAARTDASFHALADPTRRDLLRVVLREPHSVSDLARRYPMSFAAVQKHVAVLERAGLVTKVARGRERLVQGRIEALRDVTRALDEFEAVWRGRMERFGEVLAEPDEEGETHAADRGPEGPRNDDDDRDQRVGRAD